MSFDRQIALTVQRLRELSPARLAGSEVAFYDLLEALAGQPVPRIDVRAWADQLTVVSGDAVLRDDQRVLAFRRSLDVQIPGS